MNKNQSLEFFRKKSNISIDETYMGKIIDTSNPVIGIYGFFIKEDAESEEKCIYIGRSVNVYERLFCHGHITKLMKGIHKNKKLSTAVKDNREIRITVLEEVKFGYKNYAKDMQSLALAEYQQISEYQDHNECLEQLPDGSNMKKSVWEEIRNDNCKTDL